MKTAKVIFFLSFIMMLLSLSTQAQNRTFIFINQMNEDVWVGCQGNPLPANGGFALPKGASKTITVPYGASAIRFWGRTGCNFNSSGAGTCESGDCARSLYCNGAGGIPPATLAEFTMNGAGNQDFYDISLVDGYNLPMRIIPVPGTFTVPAGAGKYGCGIAGCTSDLLLTCPTELRTLNSTGKTVGCMSACMKYNTDAYCCKGANNLPSTCPPTNYSRIFKAACPDAYSYAYDDQTSTYICLGATYQIVFGTGGTNPQPTGVATMYKDCNYGGYAVGLNTGTYNLSQLQASGILNDDISSLKVNSGYEVLLFENDNLGGASVTISADNSCLVAQGWNDRVSSMIVRTVSSSFTRTIEAESYNAMAGVQTEPCVEGGTNVGWIDANDWMAYNAINFPTTGTYKVEYRVASISGARLSLDLNAGSIQLGQLNIPATGGWQNWTTISHNVSINAGTYNLGIFAPIGGWNLNWIRITKVGTAREAYDPALNPVFSEADVDVVVKELEAYPNPADNQLNLSSDFDFNGSMLKLYNATGEEVYSGFFISSMDISALETGVYTAVVITQNDQRYSSRFVKR